jgi:hypothetical protein
MYITHIGDQASYKDTTYLKIAKTYTPIMTCVAVLAPREQKQMRQTCHHLSCLSDH